MFFHFFILFFHCAKIAHLFSMTKIFAFIKTLFKLQGTNFLRKPFFRCFLHCKKWQNNKIRATKIATHPTSLLPNLTGHETICSGCLFFISKNRLYGIY